MYQSLPPILQRVTPRFNQKNPSILLASIAKHPKAFLVGDKYSRYSTWLLLHLRLKP